MIVVDTSVWIDHLRDRSTPEVARLREFMNDGTLVALTGVVRMELLRGVHHDDYDQLLAALNEFPLIETEAADFDLAADLFRAARDAGATVRSSIDCLIAAPCIRTGTALLHADADFDRLAKISNLRVVSP